MAATKSEADMRTSVANTKSANFETRLKRYEAKLRASLSAEELATWQRDEEVRQNPALALIGNWKTLAIFLGGFEQTITPLDERGTIEIRDDGWLTMSTPGSAGALMRWRISPEKGAGNIDIGKRTDGPFDTVMVGIYAAKGNQLDLCLSTKTGDRPGSIDAGNLDNAYIRFRLTRQ